MAGDCGNRVSISTKESATAVRALGPGASELDRVNRFLPEILLTANDRRTPLAGNEPVRPVRLDSERRDRWDTKIRPPDYPVLMPSVEQPFNPVGNNIKVITNNNSNHIVKPSCEMATMSSSLELFDVYKQTRGSDVNATDLADRDSDDESIHLPLDDADDEIDMTKGESKASSAPLDDDEEAILNKFDESADKKETELLCNGIAKESIDDHLDEVENASSEPKEDDLLEKRTDIELNDINNSENASIERTISSDNGLEESVPNEAAADKNKETATVDCVAMDNGDTNNKELPAEEKMDVDSDISNNVDEDGNIKTLTNDQNNTEEPPPVVTDSKDAPSVEQEVTSDAQITTEQEIDRIDQATVPEADSLKQTYEAPNDQPMTEQDAPDTVEKPTTNTEETQNDDPKNSESGNRSPAQPPEHHNEDSDECLLDISVIRDADEDNAESAYNEAHPEVEEDEDEEEHEHDDDSSDPTQDHEDDAEAETEEHNDVMADDKGEDDTEEHESMANEGKVAEDVDLKAEVEIEESNLAEEVSEASVVPKVEPMEVGEDKVNDISCKSDKEKEVSSGDIAVDNVDKTKMVDNSVQDDLLVNSDVGVSAENEVGCEFAALVEKTLEGEIAESTEETDSRDKRKSGKRSIADDSDDDTTTTLSSLTKKLKTCKLPSSSQASSSAGIPSPAIPLPYPVKETRVTAQDDDNDGQACDSIFSVMSPPASPDKAPPSKPATPPAKSLISFGEFMTNRSKSVTVQDLERFSIQKIAEVVLERTDLGKLLNQNKLQEQMIEGMRKELQRLGKQVRDLEVVNKKLMADVKHVRVGDRAVTPLRITRSVGLQVRIPVASAEAPAAGDVAGAAKKKQAVPVVAVKKTAVPVARSPRTGIATTPASKQTSSPQRLVQAAKPVATPILSQALSSRSPLKQTPHPDRFRIASKVAALPNSNTASPTNAAAAAKPASSAVIDLTDEDDRRATTATSKPLPNAVAAVPLRPGATVRLNSPQGLRLATTTTGGTQQVMYLMQSPQNGGSGPAKAVLLNFQPSTTGGANGLVPGAAIGTATAPIQLKTVTSTQKQLTTTSIKASNNATPNGTATNVGARRHPAPLPPPPPARVSVDGNRQLKPVPPKPHLTIRKTDNSIILQWKMPYELDMYEVISSYQLYAYQETNSVPSTNMWRKVGDVKALALPMACTLTQFADKNKYYFAVRPVDVHERIGLFSDPEEISL